MHLKDLLGSFVRVGYRIPVPDFYLVLHGPSFPKKHYNGLNQTKPNERKIYLDEKKNTTELSKYILELKNMKTCMLCMNYESIYYYFHFITREIEVYIFAFSHIYIFDSIFAFLKLELSLYTEA